MELVKPTINTLLLNLRQMGPSIASYLYMEVYLKLIAKQTLEQDWLERSRAALVCSGYSSLLLVMAIK